MLRHWVRQSKSSLWSHRPESHHQSHCPEAGDQGVSFEAEAARIAMLAQVLKVEPAELLRLPPRRGARGKRMG